MKALDSINNFVNAMIESKDKFEKIRNIINAKNKDVENCINAFSKDVSKILSKEVEFEDDELNKMYNGVKADLEKLLNDVKAVITNAQKGMKFISKYEQSFNIAVFGKVKAGKSYLGNFIMGNEIRDLGIRTVYDKLERPKVHVYDRGKRSTQEKLAEFSDEEGSGGFRVDPNEATSTIQLFKLGGMTWFDTPGIGSVTWENEMLAKEYVDNADLVLYLSNSDAAGTRQDFKEMKALSEKRSRFVLVLTQSDTVEEDVDDDGEIIGILTPKSEKDRRDTEQHMRSTLAANKIKCPEILTVSVKLAFESLKKNDDNMFKGSNIGDFLKILVDITRNEGAKLKLDTPIKRINAAITDAVNQLNKAEEGLSKYVKDIQDKNAKIINQNRNLLMQMQNECINRLERIIRRKAAEIDNGGAAVSSGELQNIISKEITDVLSQTCSKKILQNYADNLKIDDLGFSGELKMRTDTIEYTVKETLRYRREPDGFWENIGALFGNKYYGHSTNDIKKTSEVQLGVNAQQVIKLVRDQLSELFEDESKISKLMRQICTHFTAPIDEMLNGAAKCIKDTSAELANLKN